jgi:hypothetical protein
MCGGHPPVQTGTLTRSTEQNKLKYFQGRAPCPQVERRRVTRRGIAPLSPFLHQVNTDPMGVPVAFPSTMPQSLHKSLNQFVLLSHHLQPYMNKQLPSIPYSPCTTCTNGNRLLKPTAPGSDAILSQFLQDLPQSSQTHLF